MDVVTLDSFTDCTTLGRPDEYPYGPYGVISMGTLITYPNACDKVIYALKEYYQTDLGREWDWGVFPLQR